MKHVKDHRVLEGDDPRYLIRIFEGHTVDGVIYVGEFKIYTIVDVRHGIDYLPRAGGTSAMDYVPITEIDAAEVLVHGSVKFDGCSNWWIDNGDTAIHHCFADELRALFEAITCAHKLAAAVPTVPITGADRHDWGTL